MALIARAKYLFMLRYRPVKPLFSFAWSLSFLKKEKTRINKFFDGKESKF